MSIQVTGEPWGTLALPKAGTTSQLGIDGEEIRIARLVAIVAPFRRMGYAIEWLGAQT
jgi:hypothetical protein